MTTSLITMKSAALSLLMGGLVLTGISEARSLQEHDHGEHGHDGKMSMEAKSSPGDAYLLGTDAVTGKALGAIDSQVIIQHEGRELRFAGEESAATFRADPAKYLPAVDKKMIAQQMAFYPLDTCPISGENLVGDMGDPIDVIYKNRLVRLCCKGCKKDLAKDPAAVIAKLDKAVIAAQKSAYPMTTCPVSGEPLVGDMGDPIEYVVGNRLVMLCCKGCKKKIAKDPMGALAKLDAAAKGGGDQGEMDNGGGHGEHGHHDG